MVGAQKNSAAPFVRDACENRSQGPAIFDSGKSGYATPVIAAQRDRYQ